MKKSLVAIGVIVVLGAAWTGASWYTGKQFEQRLPGMLGEANSRLKAAYPEAGVQLAYRDYHRSVFHSKLDLVVQSDGSPNGQKMLKPGEEILVNEKIDHGPFPLAQLKKGVLLPSMASVHGELANTAVVKAIFDASQGKVPVSTETRISYNGDTATVLDVAAMEYKKEQTEARSSGGSFDIDADKDGNKVKIDGGVNSLTFSGLNQWQQRESLTVQDLRIANDTHKNDHDTRIGDNTVKAKTISYEMNGKPFVVIDGAALVTNVHDSNDKLNGDINYQLDKLTVQGQDFGSGKLVFKLADVDNQALSDFMTKYQQQIAKLDQQDAQDPQALQAAAQQIIHENLPLLLKGSPSVAIAPLSWKNSKGESTFDLKLNFNDISAANDAAKDSAAAEQQMIQGIKTIEGKLTIPLDMAAEATTQFGRLQGYSDDDAQKLAKQQVQGLAAMGQMFKLTTVKDNTLSSTFRYADNMVDLNGQKMSILEFLGLFGMFGMPQGEPAPVQPDAVVPQQ